MALSRAPQHISLSDYSIVSGTDENMRLNISSSSCCKDSSDRLQPAMNTIEMKLIFKINVMPELPTDFSALAFHVLSVLKLYKYDVTATPF